MKSIHRIGIGAVLLAVSACAWLACDDTPPDTSTPGDDASTEVPSPDSGTETGTGSDMDGGTDAANPGDGNSLADTGTGAEAGTVTCSSYCDSVMTACTGDNAQYVDKPQCMTTCALFPAGSAGMASGNSLACRAAHAAFAKASGAVPHCWHAGPFGYGGCGTECEDFCLLATTYCSAPGGFDGGAPYASMSDCTTACAGFAKIDDADGGGAVGVDGGYNGAGPTGGNTLDCREWHLDKALQSLAGQAVHCNHVGATSPVCK